MILEKVYDELIGMIEDLQKKVAGISGGSDVTITPTLESGVKLADYSIDEIEGAIYAPSNEIIYSTTEKVIGKWIDNAPVYEKVIDVGALPNNSTKTIDITDLGIDSIIELTGFGKVAATGDLLPLPYVNADAATNNIQVYASSTSIIIKDKIDFSSFYGYLIIKYTKTPPEAKKTTKKK